MYLIVLLFSFCCICHATVACNVVPNMQYTTNILIRHSMECHICHFMYFPPLRRLLGAQICFQNWWYRIYQFRCYHALTEVPYNPSGVTFDSCSLQVLVKCSNGRLLFRHMTLRYYPPPCIPNTGSALLWVISKNMFVLPNFCVINYLYFGIITLCY